MSIMRSLIAASLLFASFAAPALAAPPASCASKFIGEWRHSGSGNRGSVKADGRALCSEHPACVQGTWTCSGNVFIYTNSLGTWNYTLAPDGRTMSTGTAVATRIGPAPASATSAPKESASSAPAGESNATSSVCARIASKPIYLGVPTNERCAQMDAALSAAREAGCEKDGNSTVRKQVEVWKREKGKGGRCSPDAVHERQECVGGADYYMDLAGKVHNCPKFSSTGSRG